MQLEPEYKFSINQKILPGMVAAGRFSSKSTYLATAINGGKVLITNLWHASQSSTNDQKNQNFLNINQRILSLTTGMFNSIATDRDLLFIGTGSNLMVYDIENNSDVFFKDIPDGVSSCIVGCIGDISECLVIVGGHCSLAAFDSKGEEKLWSVTGDNVTSLTLVEELSSRNNSNNNLLVVGSEDFELRVFRHDDIIEEITETEVVTSLCSMGGSRFGYGLANGTVGVYDTMNRLWRIKRKCIPTTMIAFDMNGDGVNELITGWSNGDIDARKYDNGEILFKDNLKNAVSGVVKVAHPHTGEDMVLVCTNEGEIRIYNKVTSISGADSSNAQDAIFELTQRKQNLTMDMKNYEDMKIKSQDPDSQYDPVVPIDTKVDCKMKINKNRSKPGVDLVFQTNNGVLVRCVMVFAEGIFEGECYVAHPAAAKLSNQIIVPIYPPKDIAVDLHIKVMVGQRNKNQLHVFNVVESLPRFAMYSLVKENDAFKKPLGYVVFSVQERLQRYVIWVNQNFLLDNELSLESKDQSELTVRFVGLRQKVSVELIFNTKSNQVTVATDSMELASMMVQSLVEYLNITNMTSHCQFPLEFQLLGEVVSKIDGIQSSRQRMTVDIADTSGLIKNFIVRAEDCRIMEDMHGVKKYYSDLLNLNKDLVNRFKMRSSNHQELVSLLKFVNQFIQRGGNLRAGKYRTQLVSQCRQAVKENQLCLLEKLIKTGVEIN